MVDKYYSVEQISEMLNIHPKTIQRYIREGKLFASKIGKSWRITGHDLSIFIENSKIQVKAESTSVIKQSSFKTKISSVIDIDIEGNEAASRIINAVMALPNTKCTDHTRQDFSTIHTQFIEVESKVRITIWGNIQFAQAILNLVATLTESIAQENHF
jgi:excisionase family DNA binding protein